MRYIPGFDKKYLIDKEGDVFSFYKNRILSSVEDVKGGHRSLRLTKDKVIKKYSIHYLVMITYVGPRPEGYEINHKNGIKWDNRLENLEYVTPSENILHAYRTGLKKPIRGEQHHASKLKKEDIPVIKRLAETTDMTQGEIGKLFGVTNGEISNIIRGTSWSYKD